MHQHDILPIANFSATPLPVEIEKERASERERARIFIVEEVPYLWWRNVLCGISGITRGEVGGNTNIM